jgi:15-cis-phytoene synthase
MTIDEAYAFCRRITHRHGANFSVGFRFLPPQKQRGVYAAYAFCRWADDIADEPGGMGTTLDEWEKELERTYAGQPTHPIGIALADTLKHFPIPKSAFVALINGCRQDMVKTRYETFEELLQYCELVAASISDISLAIFGYRSAAAIDYGRDLSTALQLTNVTRDIGDDLARDRVYVPRQELAKFGLTEKDLFDRRHDASMRAMIDFQIDRAESYFRKAEPLLDELEFDARFPVLLMGGVYATVLHRLRENPLIVLRERLSLSRVEKIAVVLKRLLRPHFV